MKKILFFIVLVPAWMIVDAAIGARPNLADLMRASGKAHSAIDKGIAKGRWDGLVDRAQLISDQAMLVSREYEPPMHKEELAKFRILATQLAKDAQALKAQLAQRDAAGSKKLLKAMEKTCISCHRAFVPKKK